MEDTSERLSGEAIGALDIQLKFIRASYEVLIFKAQQRLTMILTDL
jgi:hypothetical protein